MLNLVACVLAALLYAGPEFPPAAELPPREDLPDPLLASDGSRIESPEAWNVRREQIKALLLHYAYGQAPPPPAWRVEAVASEPVLGGAAQLERFTLVMGPGDAVRLRSAIYVPAGAGTRPVLLAIEPVWEPHFLPIAEEALRRGYSFAGYQRHDLDPDDEDRSDAVHPLYHEYDWATLAVWAWGASRVVDYLCSRDDVDAARIALTGHSRAGKTALLAAALDERIALVAPHGSGAGGAGSFRIAPKGAETLELITSPKRFHYWFHPRLREFVGKEDRLPFDQHFLRALIAPRVVVSVDGLEDHWANPVGTKRMWEAAQPVFDLLGTPDRNVLHFRQGGHDMTEVAWRAILDYCDHFFFDKPRPPDTPPYNWADAVPRD